MSEANEAPSPRRLLIVDDDQEFAESISDILIPAGYAPIIADRPETAAAALKSHALAVALIDVRLRGMSGVELLSRLKAERPDLVVVMMTAHADTQTAINALRKGAYDYCDKNCDPDELIAALDRAFERQRLETENRSAYETLRTAKDAAEAASRAKTEFLANVSHELRTPLNAIIGFSELMLNGARGPVDNADYRGYLKDIFDAGTDLLRLINEILDLSKAEAGKLELNEDVFDLRVAFQSVDTLTKETIRAAGLSRTVEFPTDLPLLRADELKTKQVLLNLISNAVKFTAPGGEIRVVASVDQHGLAIAIADNGVGIAAEHLDRVLEPFEQVDCSLSRQHQGTGLGLPLVKAIMESHGGTMVLASTEGVGTQITLTFPSYRLLDQASVVVPPERSIIAFARAADELYPAAGD
jgi:signal transduction histidine kinase